jgi:hypothetical protein
MRKFHPTEGMSFFSHMRPETIQIFNIVSKLAEMDEDRSLTNQDFFSLLMLSYVETRKLVMRSYVETRKLLNPTL